MIDQAADWILAAVNSVPILLGADQHHAELIRGMAALLLIAGHDRNCDAAISLYRRSLFEPRAQTRPAKSVNRRVK